jgi:hypothetical protein
MKAPTGHPERLPEGFKTENFLINFHNFGISCLVIQGRGLPGAENSRREFSAFPVLIDRWVGFFRCCKRVIKENSLLLALSPSEELMEYAKQSRAVLSTKCS